MILYIFYKWSTTYLPRSLELNVVARCTKIWGQFCDRRIMFRILSSEGKQSSSTVVSKCLPNHLKPSYLSHNPPLPVLPSSLYFFSSLSFFASYLVHQFMEERGNHIYFSQEKRMTFHIQFFLDVNLGSWMQHFIVWFGLFSIVLPILLNCSLPTASCSSKLIHLQFCNHLYSQGQ